MGADLEQKKTRLENKIYTTKKSSIEAASRCDFLDKTFTVVEIIETVILILLDLIKMNYGITSDSVTILTISIAITLLSLTLVKKIVNYDEKYRIYKNRYNKLEKLEQKIASLDTKSEDAYDKIDEIANMYNDVLNESINHETIDYLTVMKNDNTLFTRDYLPKQSTQNEIKEKSNLRRKIFLIKCSYALIIICVTLIPFFVYELINIFKIWLESM